MPKPVDDIPVENLGVQRDRTLEAVVELKNICEGLQRTAIDLESKADSEFVPDNLSTSLRNYSQELHDVSDHVQQQAMIERSRLDKIRSRLDEEVDD